MTIPKSPRPRRQPRLPKFHFVAFIRGWVDGHAGVASVTDGTLESAYVRQMNELFMDCATWKARQVNSELRRLYAEAEGLSRILSNPRPKAPSDKPTASTYQEKRAQRRAAEELARKKATFDQSEKRLPSLFHEVSALLDDHRLFQEEVNHKLRSILANYAKGAYRRPITEGMLPVFDYQAAEALLDHETLINMKEMITNAPQTEEPLLEKKAEAHSGSAF